MTTTISTMNKRRPPTLMTFPSRALPSARGFTLLELMVVVAIIAILATLAYPSYVAYITKSNRRAGEACLSTYSNYMERYYTTNLRYDQNAAGVANPVSAMECAANNQTGTNYSYSAPTLTATTYVIRATPINAQLSRDTKCGALSLDQKGTRTASASDCW